MRASRAFYARLRQVPAWENLYVAQAAQAVQRSAEPAAYAQWEPSARAVAAALTGEGPAALRRKRRFPHRRATTGTEASIQAEPPDDVEWIGRRG